VLAYLRALETVAVCRAGNVEMRTAKKLGPEA
jgi:hypothetical protein